MSNPTPAGECCPPFDPAPWDNKTFEWDNKLFIKDSVFTLFFMPINFGPVIKRMTEKVEKANSKTPDNLCLSDHTSKWNMDLYLSVGKAIPGATNTTLSGRFFSKVYEGEFNQTSKWRDDFEALAKSKGIVILKMFMWYTTCPECSKKYGKNYVVLVAQT